MRRDVNVLIFLDVRKALEGKFHKLFVLLSSKCSEPRLFIIYQLHFVFCAPKHCKKYIVPLVLICFFTISITDGMKLYISDNKVILTEGFDGAVPAKYFVKIESWPDRKPIVF